MKKPDRFERLVKRHGFSGRMWHDEVVKLLRREHAAMVRLVKRLPRYKQGAYIMLTTTDGGSPWICIDDLLAALQRRKEGKK